MAVKAASNAAASVFGAGLSTRVSSSSMGFSSTGVGFTGCTCGVVSSIGVSFTAIRVSSVGVTVNTAFNIFYFVSTCVQTLKLVLVVLEPGENLFHDVHAVVVRLLWVSNTRLVVPAR